MTQLPAAPAVYVRRVGNPYGPWSLGLGIAQLLLGGVWVWFLIGLWTAPLTAAAIVLGHVGLSTARRLGVGQASSLVGLVMGYVGLANLVAWVAFAAVTYPS